MRIIHQIPLIKEFNIGINLIASIKAICLNCGIVKANIHQAQVRRAIKMRKFPSVFLFNSFNPDMLFFILQL
eukprot:CAMPEP_0114581730 /NCGR_PEP_ID=MMETSP0125-20121206/5806_1 /TAXON_ID=485358 ORGANISM="Aristerostoma sp., Strain ATCC 50986" /NCGR_SAMPLE_ID=MMETSP0125 /ASSEMBLY_ACC=CAM_ASM_000245 /LENGTH=71 /DNA_ID=CAMNT_0001774165 /DNA_START=451 /DNA_END=666 /DNA_ORIENTATION=+